MKLLRLLVVGLVLVAGCVSRKKEERDNEIAALPAVQSPTTAPIPTPTPTTIAVTYRVRGYYNPDDTHHLTTIIGADGKSRTPEQQAGPPVYAEVTTDWGQRHTVSIPWSETRNLPLGTDAMLSAEENDSGTAVGHDIVEILINGQVVTSAITQDKPNAEAYCSFRIGPVGATAACSDKTFSFAEHRQGDCSSHGGVYMFYDGSHIELPPIGAIQQ